MRRNGNRDADRRTSVMPAATNLGSYSDRSSFFNKPASVCGCLAAPPPTLPPKMPQLAGPPSSPQEMSNILSTGIYARGGGQCGGALALLQSGWVATAAMRFAAPRLPGSSAVPGCCPKFSLLWRAGTRTKAARVQYSRGRSRPSSKSGGRQPCKELEGLASAARELSPLHSSHCPRSARHFALKGLS